MTGPSPVRAGYEGPPSGYLDLHRYAQILRRHRWLIFFVVAITVIGAASYSFTRTNLYTATAKVNVFPTGLSLAEAGTVGFQKILNMPTEAEVVKSEEVARRAIRDLRFTGRTRELLKRVQVEIVPESQVLAISFTDPDPLVSQQGALAFATGYLEYRGGQAQEEVQRQREDLEKKLLDTQTKISELGSDSNSALKAIYEAQSATYAAGLAELEQINTNPGQVLAEPDVPNRPSSPNHQMNLALGLLLGIALGVGVAFLRAQTDTRLRDRDRLEEAIGIPVLASIPRDPTWEDESQPRLVSLENPRSSVAEAYRTLRTTVLAAAARHGVRTILVTSPLAGEGKTTTAANLAVVMAQADRRVALISADLRRPRVHRFFDLANEQGLSEVLTGRVTAESAFRRTDVDGLWVLPSGNEPENPAELLQSKAMEELIEEQRDHADFVIIDCPPVLAVADSLGVIPFVDGVLFVADAAGSRVDAVTQAGTQLAQMGAPLLGAVLNDFKMTSAAYYYGGEYSENGARRPVELKPTRRSKAEAARRERLPR